MADLARIKRNVAKMVSMNAPEQDIDAYIREEGVTVEQVRTFKPENDNAPDDRQERRPERGAVGDAIQQFGENFNRGVYATANLPTTLANMATDALGIDYQFKRPLEAVAPGADREVMTVPEAQTAAGRVAGTIGEYAGANALPAGAALGMAPRIAAATAGARSLGGQAVNRVAGGIAAAPGRAALGETTATVGAGLGAQVARDIAPDSLGAEFLGATAGGIAAPAALAVAPSRLAVKGYKTLRERLSPEAVAKSQRRKITEGIRGQMTPEAEARIQESAALQKDIPGYRPSVAEATESPAFIATQKDFEAGLSGPDLDRAIRRYGENETAISRAVTDKAPQSPMSPDDVFAQAGKRPERLRGKLDTELKQGDDYARMMAERLNSPARQADYGGTIRNLIDMQRQTVKQELSGMAARTGLNDTTPRYAFGPEIKDQLLKSIELRSNLADPQARPNAIASAIQNMDDHVSITDLMELRSRISDDIRAFGSRPDGKRRVQYLESLKSELDKVSDQIIRGAGDAATAENWQRFRQAYRTQLIEPFDTGPVGKLLSKDLGGTYRVPDEQIGKELFDGLHQTAARQFTQTFAEGTAARDALAGGALDSLHAFSVRDGIIDPNRLSAWLRNKSAVLDDFPDIKRRVTGIENTVNELVKRRAVLAQRKQTVDRAHLSRELARLDNPLSGATPESVIDAAIKNPARMKNLLRSIKAPQAKEAIARQVWDQALSSGDPAQFLNRNREAVKAALGGERFNSAFRLARAIEKSRLMPRPAGQPLDTNPVASVENALGTGLNQISSRVFAVKSGRTSSRYALTDLAGRFFRTMTANQARQTLQSAIYDPEVAVDLANAIELGKGGVPAAKRLYSYMISNGIAATIPGDSEEFGPEQRKPLELTVRPDRNGSAAQ